MSFSDGEPCKNLLPFIRRANEIDKYEPRVAFYCRIYAMECVLKIPLKQRTGITNGILESLLKRLMKDESLLGLSPKDQIYIQKFANKIFMKADKNELRGRKDLNTAKTFYAASLFIGILNFFGKLDPDLELKQRYAAWRASEIRKTLTRKSATIFNVHSENQTSGESNSEVISEEKSIDGHNSKLHIPKPEASIEFENLESLSRSLSSSSLSDSSTSHNGSDSKPFQSNGNSINDTNCALNVEDGREVHADHNQHSAVLGNVEEAKMNDSHCDGEGCVYRPSAENIVKAQKVARMAVSSLVSNDVPSAISFLQEAVDLLTKSS